jgi:hypothetical protein
MTPNEITNLHTHTHSSNGCMHSVPATLQVDDDIIARNTHYMDTVDYPMHPSIQFSVNGRHECTHDLTNSS